MRDLIFPRTVEGEQLFQSKKESVWSLRNVLTCPRCSRWYEGEIMEEKTRISMFSVGRLRRLNARASIYGENTAESSPTISVNN